MTSGAFGFYAAAAFRIAFGLILISAASDSRSPQALRILGGIIVILGILTALAGAVAVERSQAVINWWEQQGPGIVRLAGAVIVTLGGFVAYACAPRRGAA